MAYYRTRADGLLEVVQDDGSVTPPLPSTIQGDLELQGIMPAVPPELGLAESGATAGLGGGAIVPPPTERDDYQRQALAAAHGQPVVRPKTGSDVAPGLMTPELAGALASSGLPVDSRTQRQAKVAQQQAAQREQRTANLVGGEPTGAPLDPQLAHRAEVERDLAALQRPVYIPGQPARDVLVGYTEQGRAPLPPEELEARRANMEAQAAEQRWQGQLMAERAERERLADYVDLQRQFQEAEQTRDLLERREATVRQLKAEADQAKADIQEVDPRAFWNEMGGEQRFFAILSVALGAFGSAFTGGENQALRMFENAFRENIDVQKQRIAQQEARATEASAAYERALAAVGGDERSADLLYEIALGNIAAQQARAFAADTDSDILRSHAEQAALQLEEANREKEAELAGLTRVRAAQFAHQPETGPRVVQRSRADALKELGQLYDLEEKVGLRESQQPVEREDLARRVVLEGGTVVYAKDSQTATSAQKALGALERYRRLAGDAKEILSEAGHSIPLSDRRTRLSAIGIEMALLIREANELGIVTDSDMKNFMEPLSALGSERVFSAPGATITKLDEVTRLNKMKEAQFLRQMTSDPQMTRPVVPRDLVQGGAREGW